MKNFIVVVVLLLFFYLYVQELEGNFLFLVEVFIINVVKISIKIIIDGRLEEVDWN